MPSLNAARLDVAQSRVDVAQALLEREQLQRIAPQQPRARGLPRLKACLAVPIQLVPCADAPAARSSPALASGSRAPAATAMPLRYVVPAAETPPQLTPPPRVSSSQESSPRRDATPVPDALGASSTAMMTGMWRDVIELLRDTVAAGRADARLRDDAQQQQQRHTSEDAPQEQTALLLAQTAALARAVADTSALAQEVRAAMESGAESTAATLEAAEARLAATAKAAVTVAVTEETARVFSSELQPALAALTREMGDVKSAIVAQAQQQAAAAPLSSDADAAVTTVALMQRLDELAADLAGLRALQQAQTRATLPPPPASDDAASQRSEGAASAGLRPGRDDDLESSLSTGEFVLPMVSMAALRGAPHGTFAAEGRSSAAAVLGLYRSGQLALSGGTIPGGVAKLPSAAASTVWLETPEAHRTRSRGAATEVGAAGGVAPPPAAALATSPDSATSDGLVGWVRELEAPPVPQPQFE